MTWEPDGLVGGGLFPPELVAEHERDQDVYFVVKMKVFGTDEHVKKTEATLARLLEVQIGSKVSVTKVKPDGSTIVLPD